MSPCPQSRGPCHSSCCNTLRFCSFFCCVAMESSQCQGPQVRRPSHLTICCGTQGRRPRVCSSARLANCGPAFRPGTLSDFMTCSVMLLCLGPVSLPWHFSTGVLIQLHWGLPWYFLTDMQKETQGHLIKKQQQKRERNNIKIVGNVQENKFHKFHVIIIWHTQQNVTILQQTW